MMKWYYILGIVSYGIFVFQFLLNLIGGHTDIDVDFDGDSDIDTSTLFSFKGFVHFCMGFSGWLCLQGNSDPLNLYVAVVIGILFTVALYYIYKLCAKLKHEPTLKEGLDLVGSSVNITYVSENGHDCIGSPVGEVYRELKCHTSLPTRVGDLRVIGSYRDGVYYLY